MDDEQQPLLNEEEMMEVDDPDFYSMVEEHGNNLDHLALEYKHRRRDAPRVLDPNVPRLPLVEEQVGEGPLVPHGLFRFRLGAILDRYSEVMGVHEQVVPVHLQQNGDANPADIIYFKN